jgi:hypothetical protein
MRRKKDKGREMKTFRRKGWKGQKEIEGRRARGKPLGKGTRLNGEGKGGKNKDERVKGEGEKKTRKK